MRLHLIIQRHGLPIVRILWTTTPSTTGLTARPPAPSSAIASARAPNAFCDNGGLTIAQLLEDINEVIPLESGEGAARQGPGQWGLEDYVVEVNGYECLHFMEVEGLLRDGDEVVIRPLSAGDMRARRLSGRVQITNDGRHLLDGVPFGRPYLKRSFPVRPPVRIPSRKRRRVTLDGWDGDDRREAEEEEDDDYELATLVDDSMHSSGTVVRHPVEYDDEDESDASFEPDAEDVAAELEDLQEDQAQEPARPPSGRRSRAAHRSSSPESVAHDDRGSEATVSPKSKAVRFEDREESEDSTAESSVESSAEESSESDTDVTSPSTSDSDVESASAAESESESESVSDSDSSTDSESSEYEQESPQPPPKKPQRFVPPGHGSSRTKRTNQRNRRRRKLAKLKQLGYLHPEANFADLRKWEEENEQNENRVLTEVVQHEARTADKEQAEFEARRERLLRQLASGGIDVDAQSEKENVPPQQTTGVISDQGEEAVQPGKRRRLDVQSSKRLLFGSLGVKTPTSREEEEATRKKLAGTPRTVQPLANEQPEQEPGSDVDENWQDKLTIMATECVHENVHIEPPPFPFKQRWDTEAQQAIQILKGRRGNWRKKRKSQGREQEAAEEETHLDYDEPNQGVTAATDGKIGDVEDDLPQLPDDPSTLPDLTEDTVKPNSVIAYKVLEISKATNWQPQVSAYKVARVDHILGDGRLNLRLAKRDREQRTTTMNEGGVREYSGFEMPGYENETDAEDDGVRTLSFSGLIEPKIVVPANEAPQEQQVAGAQDGNKGDKSVPERSPQPSPANTPKQSTAREPNMELSSQTRNDISQIIRDAGFRSTIDSDLQLQGDAPAQEHVDMHDDDGPLPPDDFFPTSFEAEQAPSPVAEATLKAASERSQKRDNAIPTLEGDDVPANLSPVASSGSDAASNSDVEREDAIPSENGSSASSPSLPKVQSPFEECPLKLGSDVFDLSSSPPSRPIKRNLCKWFKKNDDSQDTHQEPPTRNSDSPAESPRVAADSMDTTNPPNELESAQEDPAQNDDLQAAPMDDPTPTSYQPRRVPTEEPDEETLAAQPDLPSQTRNSQLDSPRRSLQLSRSQTPDRPIMGPSSSGRSGDSIVWNPFYEKDGGKYDPAEDAEPPFASTPPPPARHDGSSSTTRQTRRAKTATLSSPRQLSNSNSSAFVTPPDRRSTPRKPTEPDPNSTPTRRQPHQDQPRSSVPPDVSQIVDLTMSSPLQSPGGSDEDFAKSLGLPTGPGWIRKNVWPTERQTRSSSRALGRVGTASTSPSRRRRSRAST